MSLDEIRAPENYTSLEKAAFWFGMAFGKAETNQRGRSNPQRTIGDTHYRAASKSPDKCAVVCRKHGRYFSKRLNRMLEDQRLGAWLEQAESFLDQLSDRPRIFNPKAQRAFGRGYHTFKQANKLRQAQSTTTDTE